MANLFDPLATLTNNRASQLLVGYREEGWRRQKQNSRQRNILRHWYMCKTCENLWNTIRIWRHKSMTDIIKITMFKHDKVKIRLLWPWLAQVYGKKSIWRRVYDIYLLQMSKLHLCMWHDHIWYSWWYRLVIFMMPVCTYSCCQSLTSLGIVTCVVMTGPPMSL